LRWSTGSMAFSFLRADDARSTLRCSRRTGHTLRFRSGAVARCARTSQPRFRSGRTENGEPMKLLYRPFGLVAGALAGLMAGAIFKRIWTLVADEEDKPDATDKQRSWTEVVSAAALQGAVFGGVRAAVDRAGATGFERVTGTWPGNTEPPEKLSR